MQPIPKKSTDTEFYSFCKCFEKVYELVPVPKNMGFISFKLWKYLKYENMRQILTIYNFDMWKLVVIKVRIMLCFKSE